MKLLFLFVIILFSLFAQAQNEKLITNVKVLNDGMSLIISFDLNDLNDANKYDLGVRLFDSASYKIITPSSLAGDVSGVKGGIGKRLIVSFDGNKPSKDAKYGVIFYKVEKYTIQTNNGAVLKSILVPGLGNSKLYRNGALIATGIAIVSYGCIGYGIFNKIQADDSYQKYKESFIQSDIDNNFKNAETSDANFKTFTAIGFGIWALDVLHVALKVKANKRQKVKGNGTACFNKLDYALLPTFNNKNSFFFNLTYKF